METKEQKARKYSYSNYSENDYRIVAEDAFKDGWNEALKSLWVSMDKGFPKEWQDILMLFTENGTEKVVKAVYIGNNLWVHGDVMTTNSKHVIAWMPIPSFDNVLWSNKDVLKRLKEK